METGKEGQEKNMRRRNFWWYAIISDVKLPYYIKTKYFKCYEDLIKFLCKNYDDTDIHYFLYVSTSAMRELDDCVFKCDMVLTNEELHTDIRTGKRI